MENSQIPGSHKFLQIFAAVVLVIGISIGAVSSAATPACVEVETGAGKTECNPAKTWASRTPDTLVPDFEAVESGGLNIGAMPEFSLSPTAAGTDPAASSQPQPLPRFSGINSPFLLYDKGPTNIADNLIILGLSDARVGLINKGPILLQPVPSDIIPPPIPAPAPAPAPAPTPTPTPDPSNQPPVVTLTVTPATGAAALTITLTATASDPDGTITTVEFWEKNDDTGIIRWRGTDSASPYSINWTLAEEGTYSFTAKAKDNDNATTDSTPVRVTVTPAPRPDLIPEPNSLTIEPASGYVAGSSLVFKAKMKNAGAAAAGAANVRFCINKADCVENITEIPPEDVVSTFNNIPALAIGASSDWILTQTSIAAAGTHTVYFCVDASTAQVMESDETNNCASKTFTVAPTLQINAFPMSGVNLPDPIRGGTQRTSIFSWIAQDATVTTSGIRVTGYKIHLSSSTLTENLTNFELQVSDDNGRSDPWYPVSFGTINSDDPLAVSFVEGFNIKTPLYYRVIADVACDTGTGNITVSMNGTTDITTAITANIAGLPVSQTFTMPLCPIMTLTQLPSDNLPEDYVATQTAVISKFKASANTPINMTDLYIHQKGNISLTGATPKIRNFRLQKSTDGTSWSNVPIALVTPANMTSQDVHFAFGPVNPPMQIISTTDIYYRVEAELDCDNGGTYGFTIDGGADFSIQSPSGTSFAGLPFINPGTKMPACDMPPPAPVITVPTAGAVITDAAGWVNVTATDDNRINYVYLKVQINIGQAPIFWTDFSNTFQTVPAPGTNNYQFPVNWSELTTYYGSHELVAVTRDIAGNETQSAPINIIIPDPQNPTVAITGPTNNAKISTSPVAITATATDNVSVQSVQFFLDGISIKTDTTSPYSDSKSFTDTVSTNHTISAVATDSYGNTSSTASITITVDTAAPVVSSDASSGITTNSATITWTTNEPAYSQVEYGTTGVYGTLTTLGTTEVTNHSQTITGLASGVTYYFRVRPKDYVGNIGYGRGLSFTTSVRPDLIVPAASLDVDSPFGGIPISGLGVNFDGKAKNIGTLNAGSFSLRLRIDKDSNGTWDTNLSPPTIPTPSNQTISSLATNTESAEKTWTNAWSSATAGTHIYEVCADPAASPPGSITELDENNNCTTTAFTVGTDTTLPTLSSIQATGITGTSATITWTTDEVANSEVRYGLTNTYGSTTGVDAGYVTAHSMTLTGLSPVTTYHFQVKSTDPSGNLRSSSDYSFSTAGPDLWVSTVAWTPAPTETAVITFSATIRNDGAATTVGSPNRIRFCIDNTSCATTTTGIIGYEPNFSPNPLGSLASGSINAPATWTATNGDHTITVCADTLSTITETIETNNCTTSAIRVRPDMIISSGPNWTRTLLAADYIYTFTATVKNDGNANAEASSSTRLRIDTNTNNTWDYSATRTTAALAKGTTENETWTNVWTPPLCTVLFGSCTHTIEVCADTGGTVHEGIAYLGLPGGGTNNCSTRTVSIGAGSKGSVLHASALDSFDFGNFLSAGFGGAPIAQAAAADSSCPVAIGGITLCNPLTVFDDLYVADNEKGEPGNIIAHGKFYAQDGIETAGDLKAASVNSGSVGSASKILGTMQIDGNVEIAGNAALRNDTGSALNVIADSIGSFYTKTSNTMEDGTPDGTAPEATQYGTALSAMPLTTVACDEADDIVLDCSGYFDPEVNSDIFGKTQNARLVDGIVTAPNTCGVRAQKSNNTTSIRVYAQAVCFSPDG